MNKSNTPSNGNMVADDVAPKSIQEIARDVVGKELLQPPFTPVSGNDVTSSVLQPGKHDVNGNVSQPYVPAAIFNGNWQESIGSAKETWSKLTEEELVKSEGNEHKLAGLVQGRYGLTRDEANRQAKEFIEKCTS